MVQEVPLGHVKVSTGGLDALVSQVVEWIAAGGTARRACIPLNLSKYVMSKDDSKLRSAIGEADLVIADGVPIVWLARRLGHRRVHRITGIAFAEALLTRARAEGWRIFLLGARRQNLERAVVRIAERFDNPPIAGTRDGYFVEQEVPGIIAEINALRPDILLLGLGLPQKEYFVADHLAALDVRFTLAVGGAFDIWAGAKKRAPALVTRMGLEWAWRSLYDTSRAGLIARHGLRFLHDLALPRRAG